MLRKKAFIGIGSAIFLVLFIVVLATVKPRSSVPRISIIQGVVAKHYEEQEAGRFSAQPIANPPQAGQGFPRLLVYSAYELALSKEEAMAALSRDLGPPDCEGRSCWITSEAPGMNAVATWSFDDVSVVYFGVIPAEQKGGKEKVILYIREIRSEPSVRVVQRAFRNPF